MSFYYIKHIYQNFVSTTI